MKKDDVVDGLTIPLYDFFKVTDREKFKGYPSSYILDLISCHGIDEVDKIRSSILFVLSNPGVPIEDYSTDPRIHEYPAKKDLEIFLLKVADSLADLSEIYIRKDDLK